MEISYRGCAPLLYEEWTSICIPPLREELSLSEVSLAIAIGASPFVTAMRGCVLKAVGCGGWVL